MSLSSHENTEPKHQYSLARLLFFSHMALATTILISFAGVMFWMSYRATYEKVESELLGAAEVLDEQLKGGISPQSITIPDAFFHRFGKADRDHAYWRLWDQNGTELKSQGKVPQELLPSKVDIPKSGKRPYITRKDGRHFELQMATSNSGQILVGRPLAKEFDGFIRLIGTLFGIVTLGTGMAALIARQLIVSIARPIEELSQAVSGIRHRDLNRRLREPQPTIEMTSLAAAMNAMFKDVQDAFEKQRKFTSDAAHELRTPIAIVLSQSEHCLSRERTIEAYRDGFGTCKATALHMKKLVEDLLDLSRLDSTETSPVRFKFDLSELAHQVVKLLQPLASQKNLRLTTKLEPSLIFGDESQMRQVLMNLISNAIEYNSVNGFAEVSVLEDLDQIKLVVEDGGIGIDESHLPKVTNRFYRVDPSRTTSSTSGTGLGLSLVEEIVHAHRGKIEITSVLSQGTRVVVSLPKITEQNSTLHEQKRH